MRQGSSEQFPISDILTTGEFQGERGENCLVIKLAESDSQTLWALKAEKQKPDSHGLLGVEDINVVATAIIKKGESLENVIIIPGFQGTPQGGLFIVRKRNL